jgi:hypothetical protein
LVQMLTGFMRQACLAPRQRTPSRQNPPLSPWGCEKIKRIIDIAI